MKRVLLIHLRGLVNDGFEIGHEAELSRRRTHNHKEIEGFLILVVLDPKSIWGSFNKAKSEEDAGLGLAFC